MSARFSASLTAMFISACLTVAVSTPAQAAGLPLINSATVSYTNNTLTITGQNFGVSPSVQLDSMTFPTMSSSSGQIVADFPNSTPPSSFTPGTYFLTVTFKNQVPTIFTVDIGANGPQGPQGAQGPAGATGPAGPTGPQGQNGIQGPSGLPGSPGAVGPLGPTGPNGATGAAGPTGATGTAGATGAQGPAGAQGPQGPAGSSANAGSITGTINLCVSGTASPASALIYVPGHAFTGYSDPTSGNFNLDSVVPGMYTVNLEQKGNSAVATSVSPVTVTANSISNLGAIEFGTQSDSSNCGACGVVCASSQTCVSGSCQGSVCVVLAEPCTSAMQCCSGFCTAGLCSSTPGCNTAADCATGLACNPATHQCTVSCASGGACNGSCCSNGVCVAGNSADACGVTGGACTPCAGSQACNAGVCH